MEKQSLGDLRWRGHWVDTARGRKLFGPVSRDAPGARCEQGCLWAHGDSSASTAPGADLGGRTGCQHGHASRAGSTALLWRRRLICP